jgi:tetratricopeptide (TPR) repeat protein
LSRLAETAADYNNRGIAKVGKGDFDGAIADYSRALELDPKFAAAYRRRGIAKQAKSDFDGAIADYNRALAYAPDDAQLHKIVTGMHRAELRARLMRRLAPAIFGALALGVLAFFVTRAVKPHPTTPTHPFDGAEVTLVRPDPVVMPVVSSEPTATAPRAAPSVAVQPFVPRPPPSAAAPVRRTITFAKIRPNAGVLVAVDGDAAAEAATGRSITVDTKPHALAFSCVEDLCEPQTRNVGVGETDESIEVELKIKPAKLMIVGDLTKSYSVVEKPNLTVHPGVVVDDNWHPEQLRRLVSRSAELYRWRGTVRGITDLVEAYTGLRPEVTDNGDVGVSTTPGGVVPGTTDPVVRVRVTGAALTMDDLQRLRRFLLAAIPAHMTIRLEAS